MNNSRIIELNILGTKYKFKADDDVEDPEEIKRIIEAELDNAVSKKSSYNVDSLPFLIIAGLNLSKKYIELVDEHEGLVNFLKDKISDIGASISLVSESDLNVGAESEPLIRNISKEEYLDADTCPESPGSDMEASENKGISEDDEREKEILRHPLEQSIQIKDSIPEKSLSAPESRPDPLKMDKDEILNPDFVKPDINFLIRPEQGNSSVDIEFLKVQALKLERKLEDFGIKGEVKEIAPGPVITTFEYKPAPGIKISRIVNLENDIALALSALSVRIVAPIPGKNVIGIEVPNEKREIVRLRELIESDFFQEVKGGLPLCLGKDIDGKPFVSDLCKMPHLLIAGATGTGKSVGLNSMITSLLYKCSPDEVKLLMIDPKRIELSLYNDIPHLITPVVTDMKKATAALNWAVNEMERRYDCLAEERVRNIDQYNEHMEELGGEKLPYIVIIIDELADLMMVSSRDVETALARLAQMARAAGIHLILATQRPSVDVLTGVIKANFPTRISFQVSSKTDSRTILDSNGAETLLGNGDMIFLPPGTSKMRRLHGAYISELELNTIIDFLKEQAEPEYIDEVIETENGSGAGTASEDYDPLYDEAVNFVTRTRQASISSVQRNLRIGFNRAARIIEIMEKEGIVGPANGAKPREILVKSFED